MGKSKDIIGQSLNTIIIHGPPQLVIFLHPCNNNDRHCHYYNYLEESLLTIYYPHVYDL